MAIVDITELGVINTKRTIPLFFIKEIYVLGMPTDIHTLLFELPLSLPTQFKLCKIILSMMARSSENLDVGIGKFTGGLQNHKLKPCQGDEVSPINDVIHTNGLFSGKMKDVLIGGLKHNIDLLHEAVS